MDDTPRKLLLGGVVGGVCLVVSMIIVLSLLLCRDKYRKGQPTSNVSGSLDQDHFTRAGPGWQHANRPRGTAGHWEIGSPRSGRNADWQVGPFNDERRFWRGQHGTWQLAPYAADRCRLPRSSIGDWESSTGHRSSRRGSRGGIPSESTVMSPDPYSRVIRPLHDSNTPFSQADNTSSRFSNRYPSRPVGSTTGNLAIVPFRESRLPNAPVSYTHDGHFTTPHVSNRLTREDQTRVHRTAEPRRPSRDDVSSMDTRHHEDMSRESDSVHHSTDQPGPRRERPPPPHHHDVAPRFEPRQTRYIRSAEHQRKHSRDAFKRNGVVSGRRGSSEEQTHAKLTKPEDLHWPDSNLTHDSGFHELHDEDNPDVKRGLRLPRIQNVYLQPPADSFM